MHACMHICIFTFLHLHSHITYKWWNNKIIKICSHVKMQILRNQVCIQLFVSDCHSLLGSQTMGLIQICFTAASACGRRIHDGLVRRWAWLPQRNFSLCWWSQLTIPYSWWKWAPSSEISIAKFVAFVGWTLPWMLAMSLVFVKILCIWFYNITPHRFMFW